jgi:hypothetical protein
LRDKVAELTIQLQDKSTEVEQLIMELGTANNSIRALEDDMDRMEDELNGEIDRLLEVSYVYLTLRYALS